MELNQYLPYQLRFNLSQASGTIPIYDTNGQLLYLTQNDFQKLLNVMAILQQDYPVIYLKLMRSSLAIISEYNFLIKPYYFNRLSGAVSLHYLKSDAYNLRVILIGDMHIKYQTEACQNCYTDCHYFITYFLETIIKNTKAIVDFFFEYSYLRPSTFIKNAHRIKINSEYSRKISFDEVANYFADCLQIDKSHCRRKYPNLRLHYADYRDEIAEAGLNQPITSTLGSIRDYFNTSLAVLELIDKYQDILDKPDIAQKLITLSGRQYSEIMEDVLIVYRKLVKVNWPNDFDSFLIQFKLMLLNSKIKKQFDNLPQPYLAGLILEYLFGLISKYKRSYQALIQVLQENINTPLKIGVFQLADIISGLKQSFAFLLVSSSSIMDAYLLGRLFRTYQNAPSASNVIIYAGTNHINNYLTFLKTQLQFETLGTSIEEKKFCLSLSNVPQPFLYNDYSHYISDLYKLVPF